MPAGDFRLEVALGDASFSAEGKPELVLQAFEVFREELRGPKADQRTPLKEERDDASKGGDSGEAGNGAGANGAGADPHASFAKGKPLGAFLTEKAPKTNSSAVAVMAVWANANEGTTEFTVKVMEDLWRRSPRKKPANVPRDMGMAAKSGWLDKAGRAKYTLPSYGIDFVRGLPEKAE